MEKEQIIKALECCASEEYICKECPIDEKIKDDCECGKFVARNALALIKAQEKQLSEFEANNKDLAAERDRYFDMVCRAVDNAANYEEYTDATIKGYFDFTDEEYDAVTKYIQDEFYPDITEELCAPDKEVLEGSWGFDGLGWSCSSCGEYPVPGQADPHKPMLDTCPNCWAVMTNACT